MEVWVIKNKWFNVSKSLYGVNKVRLITAGKSYDATVVSGRYYLMTDLGTYHFFDKSLFLTKSEMRIVKLGELGI